MDGGIFGWTSTEPVIYRLCNKHAGFSLGGEWGGGGGEDLENLKGGTLAIKVFNLVSNMGIN